MSSLTFFPQSEVYPFSSIYPQTVSIPVLSNSFSCCPKNISFPRKKMSSAKVFWYIQISTTQNVLDNEGNNSQQHPLLARTRPVEYWRPKTARPRGNCVLNPVEGRVRPQIYPPSPKGQDSEDQMQQGADLARCQPSQHKLRTGPQAPKCPRTAWNHTKKQVSNHNKSSTRTPWTIKYPHPTGGSNDQWVASHPPWQCPTGPRPSLSLTQAHTCMHRLAPSKVICVHWHVVSCNDAIQSDCSFIRRELTIFPCLVR